MTANDLEPEERQHSPLRSKFRPTTVYAVALATVFIVAGIAFALYAFPELSTLRAITAGFCFGGFLALCSITYSAF